MAVLGPDTNTPFVGLILKILAQWVHWEPDLRKHHVQVVPGFYPETWTGLGVQVGNLGITGEFPW